MSNLKTCPACNGQGFVAKWDNDQVPPVLHKCECVRCGGSGSVEMSQQESVKRLADAFGVDVVIPVRCRDCWRRGNPDLCPMCFLVDCEYDDYTMDDGFCDRGERKENER